MDAYTEYNIIRMNTDIIQLMQTVNITRMFMICALIGYLFLSSREMLLEMVVLVNS